MKMTKQEEENIVFNLISSVDGLRGTPETDEEWCAVSRALFGVEDIRNVNVNIVMGKKRQVVWRRKDYICGNRFLDPVTNDAYCNKAIKTRCIDVPLTKCPFRPVSIKTGKELKPRYVE